jgi:hypothetical protein
MRAIYRTLGVAAGLLVLVGVAPRGAAHAVSNAPRARVSAVPGPPSTAAATTASPPAIRETRTVITRTTATTRRAPVAAPPTSTTTPRTTTTARTTTTPPPAATARPLAVAVLAPPTSCPTVIASVVWPRTWRAICAGPRAGILGLTGPDGVTTLYVRADESLTFMRVVALHEAGHAWDFTHLTPPKIAQWCAARGCSSGGFFAGGAAGAGWHEPGGAEDWAASWDACHGGTFHRSYLGLPAPDAAQCALQNTLVGYPNG